MVTEFASSVMAVALRLTKIDATGAPIVGVKNSFATSKFTRVSWTPEYDEGDEITEKDASGNLCTYFKVPDVVKKANLEIAICQPIPALYEFLGGGSVVLDAAAEAGWAMPAIGSDALSDPFAAEVWSRRIINGRPAAVHPFYRWVFPWVQTRLDGERVLEGGNMAHAFGGEGYGNDLFGDGPIGDYDFASPSAVQFVWDDAAPSGVNDYVAVIADV